MISKESINYSFNNLKKNKARTILTILSIFVGIATIFIFVSYGWGLYNYIDEFTSSSSADKLLIQPIGQNAAGLDTPFKLLDGDIRAIKNAAGISDATGVYIKAGEIIQDESKKYVFVLSYDPKLPMAMELFGAEIIEGRSLTPSDSGKVTLGYNYMIKNKIFPKAYSLNNKINIQGQNLRIVGFYGSIGNPQDDSNIYVTNNFIHELYPKENLSYGMIIARADKNDLDGSIEKIEKKLRQYRNLDKGKEDFSVESYSELLKSFTVILDIIIGFILLIAFISIIVSVVNTANTMITSVLERFKEIGVLKSIGARNSEIFKIFLFESGFLGFVAGVIGVLVGWWATVFAAGILNNLGYGFLTPHYSWYLFVACILFATLTGAISGMIPAWKASKINAVDALRYE